MFINSYGVEHHVTLHYKLERVHYDGGNTVTARTHNVTVHARKFTGSLSS